MIISFEMLSGPGAFLSLSWFIALLILFFEVILSRVSWLISILSSLVMVSLESFL